MQQSDSSNHVEKGQPDTAGHALQAPTDTKTPLSRDAHSGDKKRNAGHNDRARVLGGGADNVLPWMGDSAIRFKIP